MSQLGEGKQKMELTESHQEVSETSTGTTWKTAGSDFTQLAAFKRTTGNEPAPNLSGNSKGQMAASPWGRKNLI